MKAKKTKNSSICFSTHCKMKLICGDCFEKIQKMARDNPRNKLFFSGLLKFFTFHPFKKRLTATQRKEPTYCVMEAKLLAKSILCALSEPHLLQLVWLVVFTQLNY